VSFALFAIFVKQSSLESITESIEDNAGKVLAEYADGQVEIRKSKISRITLTSLQCLWS
jgi:hypothetical protein